ncbi:hypothetical protein U0358_11185 [Idiomarina sp. PL1-037]|uniref:hypothetical protein n=1 Tax=Idiomarina sp. PL1-037 TaxID=3095365 RepID=UPI002ACC0096|nr:hypothetical protein [Idiomarina sp. PL1-037]WQC52595.1 hypothetical protein U0358_11185 [Idiomarina sp. PL1-037]
MAEQVDDSSEDTCAGRPIRAAMHPFSVEFLAGCRKFSDLAEETEDGQEVMIYTTSCIVNAVCFMEAKLNEEVAIARICFDEDPDERKRWDEVKEGERRYSVPQKWNQVAALTGGCRWNSGEEPFQSFETISSLRNELVHFKGELLGKDEAPSRRIAGLMQQLGVKSKATWVEDDCSSWVTDLLSEKSVIRWVSEKITLFDQQYYALMHGRS